MQKIAFKPENIKKIIELYYRTVMLIPEAKVTISNELIDGGYGPMEGSFKTVKTKFVVNKTLQIAGDDYSAEEELSIETIKEIFSAMLNSEDMKLVDLELDNGVNNSWEGYGMDERQVHKPYFKGINATIEEQKTLSKKFNLT